MPRMMRQFALSRTILLTSIVATLPLAGCAAPCRGPRPDAKPDAASVARLAARRPVLQAKLDALRERLDFPGATFAVVTADGATLSLATGVSNKPRQTPMRPHDRMMSGSIGKTYVAAVLLQLLEEGRVDLDRKAARWFAGEAWYDALPNAGEITLRMLMNHTSGLPDHVWMPKLLAAYRAEPQKVWRPEELMSYIAGAKPLFPAGEGWAYADANYILVGMIIERVAGRAYYDALADRILRPWRLDETSPSDRPELRGLVSGYAMPRNPFGIPEETADGGRYHANPQMEWCGGGLISTATDLAKWAHYLYGGDVLKPKTRDLMLSEAAEAPQLGVGHRYGLGVIIRPGPHGETLGHSGFFPGYVSLMAYDKASGLAVAIQINTSTGRDRTRLERFVDEVIEELEPAEPPA